MGEIIFYIVVAIVVIGLVLEAPSDPYANCPWLDPLYRQIRAEQRAKRKGMKP